MSHFDRHALAQTGHFFEFTGLHQEARAIEEDLVGRTNRETYDAANDEHGADRDDQENHVRRFIFAVVAIHRFVHHQRQNHRRDNAKGQRQQCRRQGLDADPPALEQPGKEDGEHGAKGHHLAMAKV